MEVRFLPPERRGVRVLGLVRSRVRGFGRRSVVAFGGLGPCLLQRRHYNVPHMSER